MDAHTMDFVVVVLILVSGLFHAIQDCPLTRFVVWVWIAILFSKGVWG